MNRISKWASILVMLGSAAACGGSEPPPSPPPAPPPAPTVEVTNDAESPVATTSTPSEPVATAAPTAEPAPPSPPVEQPLTDAQILHVLHTANTGEIEQAKLAQKKSKNAHVKKFAAMMVKDHGDADKKGSGIAKKIKTSPESNEVSSKLEGDAKQLTSSMSSETGPSFDKAYIDAQVKEHRAVLDTIDHRLLPGAKSDDVKSFLQAVRGKVDAHLKEATEIKGTL
jgi:putative membrane protein